MDDTAFYLKEDVKANVLIFIQYPNKKIASSSVMAIGKKVQALYFSVKGQKFADIWNELNDATGKCII